MKSLRRITPLVRRTLILLLAGGLAGAALAPAAGAQSTASQKVWASPADPEEEVVTTEGGEEPLEELAPEEHLAKLAENDVAVSQEERAAILASSCRTYTGWRGGKNGFGQFTWKYFQKMGWCYNGFRVTSAYWYVRWGETYLPGWTFRGHKQFVSGGGAGSTHWRRWTQGNFCLVPALGCVQEKNPWLDMTVYGNGGYAFSSGG
ncbi:hypothetical protein JYK22_20065, partial [Nonomuraea sp. RK-328]|nr:hypothetical protein [Nonomuraea sp. RK-328]